MTTEPRQQARARVSPLELRLYVAALLAAVYVISWRAIGGQAAAPKPVVEAPPAIGEPAPRFVWIDQLPPSARPAIALPAGWQLASNPPPVAAPSPSRVVRVATHRTPRVRTRSS